MTKRAPRRKKDGSIEFPVACPACGSGNLEINGTSGMFSCWSCPHSGKLSPEDLKFLHGGGWDRFLRGTEPGLPSFQPGAAVGHATALPGRPPSHVEGLEFLDRLTDQLPGLATRELSRRRQEQAWITGRYRVRWDGDRLCWPCYLPVSVTTPTTNDETPSSDATEPPTMHQDASEPVGWSRRSVCSWESPKTLTVDVAGRGKALLGGHLLTPGCRVVLVEGDWKAASIPLPWVGVALLGTKMTDAQRWALLACNPCQVVVCLDGGFDLASIAVQAGLLPFRAQIVSLPKGCGPDDIERSELVRLLLEATP